MDSRLYFVLGDLAANLLVGALAGWLSAVVIGTGWNMFLAMFLAMGLGMLVGLVLFFPLGMAFGAMEVMLPTMFSGMLAGMVVGVMVGSWLGTWLRQFIPEGNFLLWFRLLVSLLALRMIALVLWP